MTPRWSGDCSVCVFVVTYQVHFAVELASFAEDSRVEFQAMMGQVAEAVSTIPAANAFWSSIGASVLQIEVAGHRLLYRVLPRTREIRVVEIQPLATRGR